MWVKVLAFNHHVDEKVYGLLTISVAHAIGLLRIVLWWD